jgi:hypothetical protein
VSPAHPIIFVVTLQRTAIFSNHAQRGRYYDRFYIAGPEEGERHLHHLQFQGMRRPLQIQDGGPMHSKITKGSLNKRRVVLPTGTGTDKY